MTSEAMLGTVTSVVVCPSALSPADLRTLVQASLPWQSARGAGDETRIEWAWLTVRRHTIHGRITPAGHCSAERRSFPPGQPITGPRIDG
ncbi:hypothetical protein [Actinoplanes sp. NPDC051851]|uniref:hypothetical protein n=1 Tax=Actinoplanes sp. NPDC051851 TaxID=3154753 RepID=UPI0034133241